MKKMKFFILIICLVITLLSGTTNSSATGESDIIEAAQGLPPEIRELVDSSLAIDHRINLKMEVYKDIKNIP